MRLKQFKLEFKFKTTAIEINIENLQVELSE